ncbi:MAG: OsmC family protein [Xanthomonadaceae bacterium]|nr:OsmC family protein [Xanthomonadaceae bacterium]
MAEHQDKEQTGIRIVLEQEGAYAFKVSFEGTDIDPLFTDESPPLGEGRDPNPSALLLASIANCLSASLLFALRKFRNSPGPIRAEIVGDRVRNAEGRWRIPHAQVAIHLSDSAEALEHLPRVLAQFEQFCVVTQSVREGVRVDVRIHDASGRVIEAEPRDGQ